MPVATEKIAARTKSYTSIYDFLGSTHLSDLHYIKKPSKKITVFQAPCGDNARVNEDPHNSLFLDSSPYVTSEQYHLLNREASFGSVAQSTSTIFYDLDDIAKRHSFHTINEINSSNVNLLKVMKIPLNTNGFRGKSDAIVQECATQIKPKLLPRDSIEINIKKVKRNFPRDAILSSEIFLRDDIYSDKNKRYYDREITDGHQKFWSFAKYRTEYTNPIPEERKRKKKDRGKRTEDPCPCQLFSYACPCTDKKSLTELAKNSKSLTVADQITSTTKFQTDTNNQIKNSKEKQPKNISTRENKLSKTDYNLETFDNIEVVPLRNETAITVAANKNDIPKLASKEHNKIIWNKEKVKSSKKSKKITCPKCKENVDILLSTTDEEKSLRYAESSTYRIKEDVSKNVLEHRSLIPDDACNHQPRCELIPVCQILPSNNVYSNHKCIRKQLSTKSPKVIRITKACRHHPPCTVVPSCQRANVLKNNCEYIPPCLHRPRCVNLPLCVPASKTIHYEEPVKNGEENKSVECPHKPRCKYYPKCQYDPKGSNLENHINIVSQVQNTCEFLTGHQKPFVLSSKGTLRSSQPNKITPIICAYGKCNKSCQFDCTDCKCNSGYPTKQSASEVVIFIRDVGCQFRNKRISPKESDQSKVSSDSSDMMDRKIGNYYANVHTLRYEDKYTNPVGGDNFSEISSSFTSLDVDSQCPTHGEKSTRRQKDNISGFIPKLNVEPYIAYTTNRDPMVSLNMCAKEINESSYVRTSGHVYGNATFPVKSRRSFLKGKYKKMFSMKRRRKSRASTRGFLGYATLKPAYTQNT